MTSPEDTIKQLEAILKDTKLLLERSQQEAKELLVRAKKAEGKATELASALTQFAVPGERLISYDDCNKALEVLRGKLVAKAKEFGVPPHILDALNTYPIQDL